jgi:hypothetical protein
MNAVFVFHGATGATVETDTITPDPDLVAPLGGVTRIVQRFQDGERQIFPPHATSAAPVTGAALGYSGGLGSKGGDVHDATAAKRITAQHAALTAAGVQVDASQQVAVSGTRMAEGGYQTQAERAREHGEKLPVRACIDAIVAEVQAERRRDVVVSARDAARNLTCNGKIKIFDRVITPQAIRGLALRCDSPMTSYVMGLYERIVTDVRQSRVLGAPERPAKDHAEARALVERAHADRAKIGEILAHELNRAGDDVKIKLRMRDAGPCDIFAALSPSYGRADAPDVLPEVRGAMPADARATWAYDPSSTSWEVRAAIWTPTPVEEQAIGEAFEGWVSYRSRDNGTGRLHGGGGVTLIRCYNASVYEAEGASVARAHRSRILINVGAMARDAMHAIHALCEAWGVARETVVEVPQKVTIEQAIPGFWRALLADRRQLAGTLPGRTADRVDQLTRAYFAERRDPNRVTRADFAQGWTRAIQDEPAEVRRDAEAAIGTWLVDTRRPMRCDLGA